MNKFVLFAFMFLIPVQFVFAEDVIMSSEQSTYYFTIGDTAIIPVDIENNSGQMISGILQYTLTQEIRQGNTQISTSNSNASNLTLDEGKKTLSLDFGSFDSPTTVTANLRFNYNNGNEMNVFLGPIKIIFVENSSQMNNSSNPMQSSTQQGTSSQNNPMNPQQSLQQKLDEMLNQSPTQQNPQQRLQNNQMTQDSSALKQQIQEQIQKDNQLQADLEKQIVSNQEFQKLHQQLVDQGYELKEGSINATTNSTGTFEADYENQEGKWGKIQGTITNGTITEIQKQTQEQEENLLNKLRNNSTFQEYEKQLKQGGFVEQNFEISPEDEKTTISINFEDENHQKATITGNFVNDEIIKVILDKPENSQFYFLPILILTIAAVIAALIYLIKSRKNQPFIEKPLPNIQKFDYISEATRLLERSKEDFKNQQFKDAYSQIGQAIRMVLSHRLGLRKEITNEELYVFLNDKSLPVNEIRKYLERSSLVEFAKNPPDKNEFENMVVLTESLFKK